MNLLFEFKVFRLALVVAVFQSDIICMPLKNKGVTSFVDKSFCRCTVKKVYYFKKVVKYEETMEIKCSERVLIINFAELKN